VTPSVSKLAILGSTGSIGRQCLSVVETLPGRFVVLALAAGGNLDELARQIQQHRPELVSVGDAAKVDELVQRLRAKGVTPLPAIHHGREGMLAVGTHPDADMVVSAAVGVVGLEATYEAVKLGKRLALSNKEVLVAAGELVMTAAKKAGRELLPVDSEHNAVHQCLRGGERGEVRRLVLTASGGPFRKTPLTALKNVTPEQALAHPNWRMGNRITIDSATMMNKGLELIEAHYLFGYGSDQIDIIVHPQSIVHGIVEYCDGSMIAQVGPHDMRVPIANCLAWPERMPAATRLDFKEMATLTFEAPDPVRFPAITLARNALVAQNGAPTVLNAANEIAVHAFIGGQLGFGGIPALVEMTLESAEGRGIMHEPADVEDAIAIDNSTRELAQSLLPAIARKAS
jgi:1-deoxy-D-xylulose-5-phosphate reductoisomerase